MLATQEPTPTNPGARSAIARPAVRPPTPEALADVALIDGPTAAAAGCMSQSSWHEAVRKGEAPAPVIRQPRCTRWRLADVRAWLIQRAASGDTKAGAQVLAQATKASAAAKRKRATVAAPAAA